MAIKIGTQVDTAPLKALENQIKKVTISMKALAAEEKNGGAESKKFKEMAASLGMAQKEVKALATALKSLQNAAPALERLSVPFTELNQSAGALIKNIGLVNAGLRETNKMSSSKLGSNVFMNQYKGLQANLSLQEQINKETSKLGALQAKVYTEGGKVPSTASGNITKETIKNLRLAQAEVGKLEAKLGSLDALNQKGAAKWSGDSKAQGLIGQKTAGADFAKNLKLMTEEQARYNREALKGEAAAQKLLNVQTAGKSTGTAIAKQLRGRTEALAAMNKESMKGEAAAQRMLGIESAGKANGAAIAKQLNERTTAQAALNKEVMKGEAAAQRMLGVQTSGKSNNRAIINQMKERIDSQAAINKANMQGATAAQNLLGIQTSGKNQNKLIIDQMKQRVKAENELFRSMNQRIRLMKSSVGKSSSSGATKDLESIKALESSVAHFQKSLASGTATPAHFAAINKQLDSSAKKFDTSAKSATNWGNNMKYAMGGVARSMGAMTYSYAALAPLLAGIAFGTAVKKIYQLGVAFEYTTQYVNVLQDSVDGLSLSGLQDAITGIDSRKGPSEIAAGMKELAKAGVDAETSLREIPELLKFASLAELELGEATKLVVGQSKAFGTTFSESANKIAAAALNSATDIQELATALSYTTELATVSGTSFTEVATSLGIMANAGIRGSKAGTAIRTSLLKMQAPSTKLRNKLNQLGISWSAFTEGGQVKNLRTMFTELKRVTDALPPADRVGVLKDLFGLRALKGGANLLRSMGSEYDDLFEKVALSSEGTTFLEEKYMKLEATGKASLERLSASWEKYALRVAKAADTDESIQGIADAMSKLLNLEVLDGPMVELIGNFNSLISVAGSGIDIFNDVSEDIKSMTGSVKELASEIPGLSWLMENLWMKNPVNLENAASLMGKISDLSSKISWDSDASDMSTFEKNFANATDGLQKKYTKFSKLITYGEKEILRLKEQSMDISQVFIQKERAKLRLDVSVAQINGGEGAGELQSKVDDFNARVHEAKERGTMKELSLELEIKELVTFVGDDPYITGEVEAAIVDRQNLINEITDGKSLYMNLTTEQRVMMDERKATDPKELEAYDKKLQEMNFSNVHLGLRDMDKLNQDIADSARQVAAEYETIGKKMGEAQEKAIAQAAYRKQLDSMLIESKKKEEEFGKTSAEIAKQNMEKKSEFQAKILSVTDMTEKQRAELVKYFAGERLAAEEDVSLKLSAMSKKRIDNEISNHKRLADMSVDKQVATGNLSTEDAELKKIQISMAALQKQKLQYASLPVASDSDSQEAAAQQLKDLELRYEELGISAIAAGEKMKTSMRQVEQERLQIVMAGSQLTSVNQQAEVAAETFAWDEKLRLATEGSEKYKALEASKYASLQNMRDQHLRDEEAAKVDIEARLAEVQGQSLRASEIRLTHEKELAQAQYAVNSEMWKKVGSLYDQEIAKVTDRATQVKDEIKNTMMGWTENLATDFAALALDADASFSDVLDSFLSMITQMVIKIGLVQPMMSGLFGAASGVAGATGTGLFGSITTALGFAQGGVPGGTGLSQHRNTVVSSPTTFAFAKGAGLMGEAGPEAIMPLTRTPDGDLGVRMVDSNKGSDSGGSEGGASAQSIRIVNAIDPSIMEDYLGSEAGEKVIMNVMSRNRKTFAGAF